jgi:hypothetical protein
VQPGLQGIASGHFGYALCCHHAPLAHQKVAAAAGCLHVSNDDCTCLRASEAMDTAPHDSLDAPSRKLKKAQLSLQSLKCGYDNACQQASQAASKVSCRPFCSPRSSMLAFQAQQWVR